MCVYGTCGHKLTENEDFGVTIAIKDYNKDGSKAIGYPTLCQECVNRYRKNNLELKTKKEEKDWFNNKLLYDEKI